VDAPLEVCRHAPAEALSLVHHHLGWGEPAADLWFVGLEEGAPLRASDLQRLESERTAFQETSPIAGPWFWQPPRPVEESGWKPSPTDWGKGRLCAALTGAADVPAFVRRQGWAGGTFNTNLFALPHQRRRPLPEAYAQLLGVGAVGDPRVIALQAERWAMLNALRRRRKRPAALVCLGLGNQGVFERAINLKRGNERRVSGGRLIVYTDERAIVVPHCSLPLFTRCLDGILASLREGLEIEELKTE